MGSSPELQDVLVISTSMLASTARSSNLLQPRLAPAPAPHVATKTKPDEPRTKKPRSDPPAGKGAKGNSKGAFMRTQAAANCCHGMRCFYFEGAEAMLRLQAEAMQASYEG